MPRLTVNGKDVEVPEGTRLIDACGAAGHMPPHFCYHPGLEPDGNCRMCMVEVEGMRGLIASCTVPAADGMVVSTETPAVMEARRGVMEFFLLHHPLDCPVCDKAGECILQNHAFDHGPGHSRYDEDKIIAPKRDLGETIALWPERCIRCRRCLRFLDDITGTSELGFVDRGDRTDIDIFPGRPIDNPMSLNIVDICPVGALISKDFLFQARVWNLKGAKTLCGGCSRGCNIVAEAYEGKVVRIRPRLNEAVNGHWMCDRGRLSHGYMSDPGRPRTPLKREDARSFNVSVSEAVEVIKAGVEAATEAYGPAAVAGLVTPWLTCEELALIGHLFRDVLKSQQLVALEAAPGASWVSPSGFRISTDQNPNRRGLEEVLGLSPDPDAVGKLAEDVEAGAVKVLWVFGGIPEADYPEGLVAVASRLDLLVVQDLAPSTLLDRAHLVLPAAAFTEKQGTYVNDDGRVQRLQPVVPPPLPGGDLGILAAVLKALGDTPPGDGSARAVFNRLGETCAAFKGLRFEDLGESGLPLRSAGASRP